MKLETMIRALVAFLVLGASSAAAEPPKLVLGAGTDLPLGIGALADLEVGPRIRIGVSGLWVPPAYVAFADEIGQSVGGYNDITSDLVRAATEDALALRFRLGWRPLADQGLYIELNYSFLTLGGGFSDEDLAFANGGQPGEGGESGWDLSSTVQQVGFEVGWIFELPHHLQIKAGLGASFTVAAKVDAEPVNPERPGLAEAAEKSGEAYLEDVFTRYVHVPVFTLTVGWDLLSALNPN